MQSQALTKANERPFSFYERDIAHYGDKQQAALNPPCDVMNDCGTFKSKHVPWFVKVNLFQRMMENDA
jgi:hypothetical protein